MSAFQLSNQTPVVILAGGEGRRMGGLDKGALRINNKRLIDNLMAEISEHSGSILISGSHDYGLDLDFIRDVDDGPKGPVGGIYAIWTWLNSNYPTRKGFFTVPVDCPKLPSDLFKRLFTMNSSAIAKDDNGQHPVFGYWRMVDLDKVWSEADFLKSMSMKRLAAMCRAEDIMWSGMDVFANINTPSDMERYHRETDLK